MLLSFLKEKTFWVIFSISLGLAIFLGVACWQMNFWPSDAEVYYMPAAKDLFHHHYLSQMHQSLDEERIKWLHGKEMHVLAIALFERLMGDTQTLRPLLVLGLLSIFLSSLLLFLIARKLWGKGSAIVVWFLFSTSFWPYLYVLFTKHQTQGLMFFLWAVFIMVYARHALFYAFAGLCMGISFFSSTVSIVYIPLVAAVFLLDKKHVIHIIALFFIGALSIVLYVNWPDVIGNVKSYAQYVQISGAMNHFFYNQRVLVQWLPDFNLKDTRGGIVWVVKYLLLVIPFIVAIYFYCLLASFPRVLKALGGDFWKWFLWVILSVSAIIMAELKGVAQYGANYFPVLMGLLAFIGWSLQKKKFKQWWLYVAIISVGWNAYVFASDIYPSRMATTQVSDFITRNNIKEIYTFRNHLLRPNILDHLNPDVLRNINVKPIESVVQVDRGYILLPPVSTDSIYRASNGDYNDFDGDLLLNNVVKQGKLNDYAVASYKTLGSSLIWSQEEEILAYRYLVLNQFPSLMKAQAWILDAGKLAKDRQKFLPTPEDISLLQNNIRNIGTVRRTMMYTGSQGGTDKPTMLKGLALRLYKVGNPNDNLRAFVFKVDDKQPMWVPYASEFISKPISASVISANKEGGPVIFTFDPPLALNPGVFSVVIYRDGKASDENFFRIYADVLGRIE